MKRRISILLVICMLLSCLGIPIYAASPGYYDLLRWANIAIVDDSISFNGTAGNYSLIIEGVNGVNRITATATLYYKNIFGIWVEIPTEWTYDVTTTYLAIDEDFTGKSGREHKVELEAVVYKDGYGEPVSKTITGTCT